MKMIGKPYKRPGKAGWWLRWTRPGTKKRLAKSFPTKGLAVHYQHILYTQINSDVFVGVIDIPISEAIDKYLEKYDLRGLSETTKVDVTATLDRFVKSTGNIRTKHLGQAHFGSYLLDRKGSVASHTLNKDIGNLKAFARWATKNKYIKNEIELTKVKTQPSNRKALTTKQIRGLLKKCPTATWRVRILLSLVTGLRKDDIDRLPAAAIDLKRMTLDSKSKKTGKVFIGRPLPEESRCVLAGYVRSLPRGQVKLFGDVNVRRTWEKVRGKSTTTRQDFRLTFSTLIQKVGSLGSAQDLLEHFDSRTTSEFYTDRELILRWKVNQLPVTEWLKD